MEINLLGAFLAIVFLASMGTLFRWMFHLPPLLPYNVVSVTRTVHSLHRILIPVTETISSGRAVELACRMGAEQRAEIILVYVVEVPMILALDAKMPEQEEKGKQALQTAEMIAQCHNLPIRSRIIHARNAADGILQTANEEDANVIVVGMGIKQRNVPNQLGRTVDDILRRSPCEVILDKAPILA